MAFALHTGMHPDRPWETTTVRSATREDILAHAGSRYAPSSPCAQAGLIEASAKPCLFIGKPCDAAGIALLRSQRPQLAEKLGLTLTFFCAGTPSTEATLDTLELAGVDHTTIAGLHYRGEGWPGRFRVTRPDGTIEELFTYEDAWTRLQRYRPMRCHLCADGVGELADISCGDAWHRYRGEERGGHSVILARTPRGRQILHQAREAGYLELMPSSVERVIAGQGLTQRRRELFGRLLGLRILGIPAPRYRGFALHRSWLKIPLMRKAVTVLGTIKRLMLRGLWHRNPVPRPGRPAGDVNPGVLQGSIRHQ
jgi:coenzyme F420 hydrogenase subunit beta